jgi:fructokinase
MSLYGGIEAGGTKFVCVVASGPEEILAETRFPTTQPEETFRQAVAFFQQNSRSQPVSALGIASFGPVDLNPVSPTFGHITATPKPGWSWTDIAGELSAAVKAPAAIDTDVNAAALGEYRFGSCQGLEASLYLTIGTGIGGGGVLRGEPLHGLVHPEMGHMRLCHDLNDDPFPGICPFHGDCFEGLASGPAIRARWGQPAETLPADHPAWDLEGEYIALALYNLVCTFSPQRIVLGGGVMHQEGLFPKIRRKFSDLLNGYIQSPALSEGLDEYILPPALGSRAGVLGAVALAMDLRNTHPKGLQDLSDVAD